MQQAGSRTPLASHTRAAPSSSTQQGRYLRPGPGAVGPPPAPAPRAALVAPPWRPPARGCPSCCGGAGQQGVRAPPGTAHTGCRHRRGGSGRTAEQAAARQSFASPVLLFSLVIVEHRGRALLQVHRRQPRQHRLVVQPVLGHRQRNPAVGVLLGVPAVGGRCIKDGGWAAQAAGGGKWLRRQRRRQLVNTKGVSSPCALLQRRQEGPDVAEGRLEQALGAGAAAVGHRGLGLHRIDRHVLG